MPHLHEKRARFNPEVRPRDANGIRGNDKKLVYGSSRQNTDGTVYRDGQKFKWVPRKRVGHEEAPDGTECRFIKINAKKVIAYMLI
jgi:hypothetical protein